MTKEEFLSQTTCPFCKIGFYLMCSKKKEVIKKGWFKKHTIERLELMHLDIMWSYESGLSVPCKNEEFLKQFVIDNSEYGTKLSLNSEIQAIFKELQADFHKDPSFFTKENVSLNEYNILLGEFLRYSDYMDENEVIPGTDSKIVEEYYNEGKNIFELVKHVTQPIKQEVNNE